MDAGKEIEKMYVAYMEKVDMVAEDAASMRIDPTTPGTVLITKRFLGI